MLNYILNKRVEKGKVNDFKDLKNVGKKIQNFILAIYDVGWDVLIANSNGASFRNKIAAKFILKINSFNALKTNNSKNIDKLASINRLPLLILAKLPKEVNDIAKYFKKNNQIKEKTKSYAQAITSLINNTREVLKIKEIFPNSQANKIKNIQRIIKEDGKPKPKLNMMTKGPSRKQIIILMNNDNRTKFVTKSSAYISNINRVLKNIKSDVREDFVQVEQAGIVIITNKFASLLDLQTIENYIKNTNQIKADVIVWFAVGLTLGLELGLSKIQQE